MYPLFESIRYKNGIPENLEFHQQRVDYTLLQLNVTSPIILADHIYLHANKPDRDNQVYKCRLQYDLIGEVNIRFEPYTIRNINTFSIHDIGSKVYQYKYADRIWINEILTNSGTDEVILTQNGYIKDTSYANLVFFDGLDWITPSQPLLMGTRRAALLKAGIIREAPLHSNDLKNFVEFRLINAMMLWEECPIYKLEGIN